MKTKKRKLLNPLWNVLIVLITFFPYFIGFSWKFLLATVLLIPTLKFSSTSPKNWLKRAGLSISPSDLKWVAVLFVMIFVTARVYLDYYLPQVGIVYYPITHALWIISPFFQSLNEEIVFRAILLSFLFAKFPHRLSVSILAALVFTIMHWLLYAFSFVESLVPDCVNRERLLFCFLDSSRKNTFYS